MSTILIIIVLLLVFGGGGGVGGGVVGQAGAARPAPAHRAQQKMRKIPKCGNQLKD